MNLLVDMGNTRLKWAVTTGGQMMAGVPLLNIHINRQSLVDLWSGIHCPKRIAVSCVGAHQSLELLQSVARDLWLDVDIILIRPQAQAFGVINAYREPGQLGVDRWLTLIAVNRQYQRSCCIVDCGTAITVDLLDADGVHQGGMISPGLTLMKKSLVSGTEALPFSEAIYEMGLASSTEAAIYSGTLMAAVGLIKQVLVMQTEKTTLILTGGDAKLIAIQLEVEAIIDPDLVLRGLLCVLEGCS
jgi:type III pantothenate kinase